MSNCRVYFPSAPAGHGSWVSDGQVTNLGTCQFAKAPHILTNKKDKTQG